MTDLFYAEANDYDALRKAICARVEQLNVSRQCLDGVTGLPSGYCGKLLAPGQSDGRRRRRKRAGRSMDVKRFGMVSLGLVLQATGLKMVLVDDRDALQKAEPMFVVRQPSQARFGNTSGRSARRKKSRTSKPKKRSRLWSRRIS